MNLAHLLSQAARRFPERDGSVWGDRSWTWAQMEARVHALAAALRRAGMGKGDRVLVHTKNCNEMFESMFAAFRLGAVWVPTNFRLMPDEVAYLAEASRREGVPVPRRVSRPMRRPCGAGCRTSGAGQHRRRGAFGQTASAR